MDALGNYSASTIIIMQQKYDKDSSTAQKVLRLYQKLLLDGRRHFQSDLAAWLNCSTQTIMRLVAEIEGVIGASLVTGLEKHRRWYQIRSISRNRLGLEFEELRYLSICRDLAEPYLPEQVKDRVEQSIFNFSVLMADQEYTNREKAQKEQIGYCAKGWIDYTPFFGILEKLVLAMDEKRISIVQYRPLGKKENREYRLAANKIISMNNALYVLGALVSSNMKERGKLVSLAVHRIKDVTLTDKTWYFSIPEEDLGLFGLPWHEPKIFKIRFKTERAVQYVKERIWSDKQKFLEQPDGSLILEMESRSEPEVVAWVRSFGDDAEILSGCATD